MRIKEDSLQKLDKKGVYKIENLINGKVYIGSTEKSFLKRFSTHYTKLKSNNHKGHIYLQNAVNKYGIENFEFSILEDLENEILEKEAYWINYFDSCNREKGYNLVIIPNRGPMSNPEVAKKCGQTIKEKYRKGEMKPNNTTFKKGIQVWNKGKKYQSTDHLKVPKKRKGNRENFSKTLEQNELPIQVFNSKMNFIKEYPNIRLLKEDIDFLKQFMILKNKKGRNGYDPYILQNFNIRKSCTRNVIYKGLIFKYNTIANIKSDKLLENPEEDNQQPI